MSKDVTIGAMRPSTTWGEYNNIRFVIAQAIAKMQTATLVKVMACTNSGGVSLAGTVDIQPLVNQVDGSNNPTPHVTIYGVPYLRIQGGTNACIIDPEVGDIGLALFASRDISKVKATKAQANPGSYRKYDWSDAMYVGGMLNGVPTQYIRFASSGISIVSPSAITVSAPSINLDSTGTVNLVAPDVAAYNTGGTPLALVNSNWLDWYTAYIQPFLVSKGYTGPVIPTAPKTIILKGQ